MFRQIKVSNKHFKIITVVLNKYSMRDLASMMGSDTT